MAKHIWHAKEFKRHTVVSLWSMLFRSWNLKGGKHYGPRGVTRVMDDSVKDRAAKYGFGLVVYTLERSRQGSGMDGSYTLRVQDIKQSTIDKAESHSSKVFSLMIPHLENMIKESYSYPFDIKSGYDILAACDWIEERECAEGVGKALEILRFLATGDLK